MSFAKGRNVEHPSGSSPPVAGGGVCSSQTGEFAISEPQELAAKAMSRSSPARFHPLMKSD